MSTKDKCSLGCNDMMEIMVSKLIVDELVIGNPGNTIHKDNDSKNKRNKKKSIKRNSIFVRIILSLVVLALVVLMYIAVYKYFGMTSDQLYKMLGFLVILLIISASIGLPIYARGNVSIINKVLLGYLGSNQNSDLNLPKSDDMLRKIEDYNKSLDSNFLCILCSLIFHAGIALIALVFALNIIGTNAALTNDSNGLFTLLKTIFAIVPFLSIFTYDLKTFELIVQSERMIKILVTNEI